MAAVIVMVFAAVTSAILLGIIRYGQFAAIDRQLAMREARLDTALQAACEYATARLLADSSVIVNPAESLPGWTSTFYTIDKSGSKRIIVATSSAGGGSLATLQRSRTIVLSSTELKKARSQLDQ